MMQQRRQKHTLSKKDVVNKQWHRQTLSGQPLCVITISGQPLVAKARCWFDANRNPDNSLTTALSKCCRTRRHFDNSGVELDNTSTTLRQHCCRSVVELDNTSTTVLSKCCRSIVEFNTTVVEVSSSSTTLRQCCCQTVVGIAVCIEPTPCLGNKRLSAYSDYT